MKAIIEIQFEQLSPEHHEELASLARSLTDDTDTVRVQAKPGTDDWLSVEFTMPRMNQLAAVGLIDQALRYSIEDRINSVIGFPRSEAEEARARRKNERRKELRRLRRQQALAEQNLTG